MTAGDSYEGLRRILKNPLYAPQVGGTNDFVATDCTCLGDLGDVTCGVSIEEFCKTTRRFYIEFTLPKNSGCISLIDERKS